VSVPNLNVDMSIVNYEKQELECYWFTLQIDNMCKKQYSFRDYLDNVDFGFTNKAI